MSQQDSIPRDKFISFRVSNDEYDFITKAKQLGLSPSNMRDLVLFGARMYFPPPAPSVCLAAHTSNYLSVKA